MRDITCYLNTYQSKSFAFAFPSGRECGREREIPRTKSLNGNVKEQTKSNKTKSRGKKLSENVNIRAAHSYIIRILIHKSAHACLNSKQLSI